MKEELIMIKHLIPITISVVLYAVLLIGLSYYVNQNYGNKTLYFFWIEYFLITAIVMMIVSLILSK